MYFSTFSSYDYDTNIIDNSDKVCIICWENQTEYNNLIKLNTLSLFTPYKKLCSCSSLLHSKCLLEWIHYKQYCPICREDLLYNHKKKVLYKTQLYRLFIFIDENSWIWIRFIIFFVYIDILLNIVLDTQNALEKAY